MQSERDEKDTSEIFNADGLWRKCTKEDFKGQERRMRPGQLCLDTDEKRLELYQNPINGGKTEIKVLFQGCKPHHGRECPDEKDIQNYVDSILFIFNYIGNEPDLEKFGDEKPTKSYVGDDFTF